MKSKTRAKTCNAIDMTKAPYTTFGVGIKKHNPKRCLKCGQPIKRGEMWTADTSAEDPDGYGRYTVIQHSPRCPNPNARHAFRELLAHSMRASR